MLTHLLPMLCEGSVQPTPRATDPTTPQGWNLPPSKELGWAPKKRRGPREKPAVTTGTGRRLMLSEAEVEDESTTLQQEYAKLMENRDAMKRQWG